MVLDICLCLLHSVDYWIKLSCGGGGGVWHALCCVTALGHTDLLPAYGVSLVERGVVVSNYVSTVVVKMSQQASLSS